MTRDLLNTAPARALGRRQAVRPPGPFSLAEVESARDFVAALIVRHGEELLPLFERLERECEARMQHRGVLDRVRAIAARAA